MSRARGLRRWLDRWGPWSVVALAAGAAATLGSYLAVGWRPEFVVQPFDRFVVATTPDVVIRVMINEFGELGHHIATATAIGLAVLVLALVALPAILALRDGRPIAAAVLGFVLPGLAGIALTVSTASAVGAGGGTGLVVLAVWAVHRETPAAAEEAGASAGRRRVLGALGTAAGLGALGWLFRWEGGGPEPDFVSIPEDARPAVRERLQEAQAKSLDVAGLEPLVSTNFYEVDINSINPDVDTEEWSLSVTGAVEEELEFDVGDIREMPFEDRFVTLRCVGDYLNGRQMDNALWTGVPVEEILAEANPQGEFVMLRAWDSYYNEMPIEALRPGLLAYRMNGRALPRAHGAPLRALVPGHWGEVNVKWLTEIEVLDRPARGYWEKRGWEGTGPVNTVAKLYQIHHPGPGRVEVAGHAYAGTRGVQAVEVSIDGGDTWREATLSEPLPGEDVWRQWQYNYIAQAPHEVTVRAIDGTGAVQIPEPSDPIPDGATGWVSREVHPR